MNDPRVDSAQAQLDDEARDEERTEALNDAYALGENDFNRGLDIVKNPFGDDEHSDEWVRGWLNAAEQKDEF